MNTNPYSAPKAAAPLHPSIAGAQDSADLFIATLPPTILKALGGSLLVTGILMLFLALRLVLNVYGSTATILTVAHILVGIPHLLFAWGATGGKTWCLGAAIALSPFVGALSLFALLTMSPAGLVGITLAVLNVVLCVMNFGNSAKIHAAKSEMKRLSDLEAATLNAAR